jgi:hypothetical protein
VAEDRAELPVGPIDKQSVVDQLKIIRKIWQQPALQPFLKTPGDPFGETDEAMLGYAKVAGGTLYHCVGTVAMGDERYPLDPQLRVRGVEGLRVIDASVMPKISSGNTNAPTIMIAEKGAEMVLADAKQAVAAEARKAAAGRPVASAIDMGRMPDFKNCDDREFRTIGRLLFRGGRRCRFAADRRLRQNTGTVQPPFRLPIAQGKRDVRHRYRAAATYVCRCRTLAGPARHRRQPGFPTAASTGRHPADRAGRPRPVCVVGIGYQLRGEGANAEHLVLRSRDLTPVRDVTWEARMRRPPLHSASTRVADGRRRALPRLHRRGADPLAG